MHSVTFHCIKFFWYHSLSHCFHSFSSSSCKIKFLHYTEQLHTEKKCGVKLRWPILSLNSKLYHWNWRGLDLAQRGVLLSWWDCGSWVGNWYLKSLNRYFILLRVLKGWSCFRQGYWNLDSKKCNICLSDLWISILYWQGSILLLIYVVQCLNLN